MRSTLVFRSPEFGDAGEDAGQWSPAAAWQFYVTVRLDGECGGGQGRLCAYCDRRLRAKLDRLSGVAQPRQRMNRKWGRRGQRAVQRSLRIGRGACAGDGFGRDCVGVKSNSWRYPPGAERRCERSSHLGEGHRGVACGRGQRVGNFGRCQVSGSDEASQAEACAV